MTTTAPAPRLIGVAGNEPRRLENFVKGRWVSGGRNRHRSLSRGHRREDRRSVEQRDRLWRHGGVRAPRRRSGAPQDDVPPARADAQGDGAAADGAEGGFLPRVRRHRCDARRFLDRHRGRHRDVFRVRLTWTARVSQRDLLYRRAAGAAVEGRNVRRASHLRAARGRGRSHQRVQLPRLGNAREARADAARRRAGDREAGDDHVVSRRVGVSRDDRRANLSRRRDPADLRERGRPARSPRRAVRGRVHRIGVHGAHAQDVEGASSSRAFASTWRRIRSTTRCSAPTPRRERRSSTSS